MATGFRTRVAVSAGMLNSAPSDGIVENAAIASSLHSLGPVRDWMAYYERFWDEHLQRLDKHLTKRDE